MFISFISEIVSYFFWWILSWGKIFGVEIRTNWSFFKVILSEKIFWARIGGHWRNLFNNWSWGIQKLGDGRGRISSRWFCGDLKFNAIKPQNIMEKRIEKLFIKHYNRSFSDVFQFSWKRIFIFQHKIKNNQNSREVCGQLKVFLNP